MDEQDQYDIELQLIYLFPEREREEQLLDTASEWNVPLAQVREDFQAQRLMGEWLQIFWARVLEPTKPKFHEITPILARVQHGCATDREFDWLGLRLGVAIQFNEHKLLKLVVKLVTRPPRIKAAHLISTASFDFFDDHGRLPSFTELRDHVRNATGERAIKYDPITEDNWTRHLRLSGVSTLFQLREGEVNGP